MVEPIVFYLLSGILIFTALMVVTQRNVFTCALYLAVALSAVAGFFVLLGADFLAAVQILLYVGGILVILVFAVMLSNVAQSKMLPQTNAQWLSCALLSGLLFLIIILGLKKNPFASGELHHFPTTDSIGHLLLGGMILPFEAVSLVLLASLVGAVLFSKKEIVNQGPEDKR